MTQQKTLTTENYIQGILADNRTILSQAITLIESPRPLDIKTAKKILKQCAAHTGKAIRIGITGAPGVGKSTFIEALGTDLVERGYKLAVLAIDPSSPKTKGSILGDKTRMEKLSRHPHAFIRPSPTAGALGGVAHKTRETMMLCEAAGFDIIFVETVGVGQSEVSVADMVDYVLLLMQPGAGDELQGIKRGIMEVANLIVVNKADGDNQAKAKITQTMLKQALSLSSPDQDKRKVEVFTCSAMEGRGIKEIWQLFQQAHQTKLI